MTKRLSQHLWRLLSGAIAATAIALLLQVQIFQSLEQIAYRCLFDLRGPVPVDERVVIIAIDDVSLRELGRFPWPRHYYTQLLDQLTTYRVSVVVMNLLWSEPSPDDAALAQAIQRQGATVLAQAWDAEGDMLKPVPILDQSAIATGHILRQEDTDGLVRQVNPLLQSQPALGFAAIQAYNLVAGSVFLPDMAAPLWLNWPGPAAQIDTYSFIDVLRGRIDAQVFRNKIVLVGATAAGLDPLVNPFDRNPPTSGLYLHATAIDNLLQNSALRPLGSLQFWLLLLLSAPSVSWLLTGWNTRQQLLAMVGLCGGWGLLSLLLFHANYWLPTAAPISLFILTAATVALCDRLREDYLLRRQVTYLWHHYHQDLPADTQAGWTSTQKPPRPKGALSQVAQLADLAQQLGRSQAMQIAIARSLPMGLMAVDGEGLIWFCNPVATQLFQTTVGSLIHPAVVPHWLSATQWQTSLDKLGFGNSVRYSDLHRSDRWFDLILQPLPSQSALHPFTGNASNPSFLLILEEITNHKQAEAALQEAKEAALREAERSAAASRAKGDFLAHMSHELRTPLNVILGFTQVISHDQALSIDHRTHLKIINRSGQHLLSMINDVLEISKIEAGRIQLNKTRFDLFHLLNDLEVMVSAKAQAKHLNLAFEPAANVPRYIATDEGKLRQILLNLLGNAIKFTEVGRITLRVRPTKSSPSTSPMTLVFEVEDTGIGIAAEALEQLFHPFTQVNPDQLTHGGAGLGLAISQTFVRLMGGDITVHSIPNQGSVFKFHIQVDLAKAPHPADQVSNKRVIALAPGQPTYRILIVEDLWENSQILVKLLEPLGFDLCHAKDGQAGINLWKQWHPHLILMDLRMPVMDGIKATQTIRAIEYSRGIDNNQADVTTIQRDENRAYLEMSSLSALAFVRTKIIALTASPFEETKANAIAIGCDDFLRKPIQESLLLAKIAEHLNVQYLYKNQDIATEVQSSFTHSTLLSPEAVEEALSQMPRTWIQQLHDLTIKGADRLMLKLVSEIPKEHDDMAKTLIHWIENFNFDEIIQLTKSKLN
ncbi:CHASE2 domain-containing protein [Nodosilinea sp. E11]|uniref:CHASE2 domain-containing protein n=1 Tax=Nodosilinea sp. E11 TaxID=3037479 RepID=UPI00293478B5|nr:CHASE2 domain-containing protein [Nodosilinea sp. E11]WOD40325.1 CHASE2 domain-containing protein [Nodosilinea sp. E11]